MNNIHKNKFNLVGSNLYFTTKRYTDIFLIRAISLYNIIFQLIVIIPRPERGKQKDLVYTTVCTHMQPNTYAHGPLPVFVAPALGFHQTID